MKKWNVPEVAEMTLAETEYGGPVQPKRDDEFYDSNNAAEATFCPLS